MSNPETSGAVELKRSESLALLALRLTTSLKSYPEPGVWCREIEKWGIAVDPKKHMAFPTLLDKLNKLEERDATSVLYEDTRAEDRGDSSLRAYYNVTEYGEWLVPIALDQLRASRRKAPSWVNVDQSGSLIQTALPEGFEFTRPEGGLITLQEAQKRSGLIDELALRRPPSPPLPQEK